jgi:hypothetical protein
MTDERLQELIQRARAYEMARVRFGPNEVAAYAMARALADESPLEENNPSAPVIAAEPATAPEPSKG